VVPDPRWSDLERPPLDVRSLNRGLVGGGLWREIAVVDETGSTNADVAELARTGAAEGLVLVAEHQIAGRGRLGRGWSAPRQSSLTFSMLLRPADVPHPALSLLPLLVGVAVAKAVGRLAEVDLGLKWPNDVQIDERKLAGILAERVESGPSSGPAVVVGVGLNVSLRADELPVPTAISLTLAGAACTYRDPLLRAILRAVADEYDRWRQAGGDGEQRLLPLYRDLCVTLGRDVRVELPGDQVIEGRAVDVDADGSLLVETATGRRSVTAGDVVHVR
jgi:BirA family transcriptional regulator, biotin operon repressor / biotin---[acetyl-CoA-carboxylase] ligase